MHKCYDPPVRSNEVNGDGQDSVNLTDLEPFQDQDTATWIKNLPFSVDIQPNRRNETCNVDVTKPHEKQFNLPLSAVEHRAMVQRLVGAGSLPNAEKIIVKRRTAFNKACYEYKKTSP
jgi:hypothetical protein